MVIQTQAFWLRSPRSQAPSFAVGPIGGPAFLAAWLQHGLSPAQSFLYSDYYFLRATLGQALCRGLGHSGDEIGSLVTVRPVYHTGRGEGRCGKGKPPIGSFHRAQNHKPIERGALREAWWGSWLDGWQAESRPPSQDVCVLTLNL